MQAVGLKLIRTCVWVAQIRTSALLFKIEPLSLIESECHFKDQVPARYEIYEIAGRF